MAEFPIRSILVGTDLTERTDPGVRAGSALAAVTGAELHLLHAFDFQQPATPEASDPPTFQDRVAQAERALAEQIERATPHPERVTTKQVVIYAAHKALLDRADEMSADLIVLGPHRSSRVGDQFLGSTADRVVRTARSPVLIVRGTLNLPLRLVLAPTDFSEPARRALEQAVAWAAALGPAEGGAAEVRALHVHPEAGDPTDPSRDPALDGVRAQLRSEAEDASRQAGSPANVTVTPELLPGASPVEEIVGYSGGTTATLLVLGTHGRGPIERALIGSVASSVARRASCSVLLVPPAG